MEQKTEMVMESREGKADDQRQLPRLFRLDDLILTQMLLSRKPIMAVAKSILESGSSEAHAPSGGEGDECFFFHASWQAVC